MRNFTLMQNSVQIELLLSLLALFLIGLIIEVILHNRMIKTIPLRISVTGTRGKTSVVRLVASIMRESGMQVLAKTTGTEAKYILPDGNEEIVKRRGLTNILEQKSLIKKAHRLKANCLVTEIMSIHPENHWLESQKLIKPHYTILTNVWPDHLDVVGKENMSQLYLNDIHPNSTLILHAEDFSDDLEEETQKAGVKVVLSNAKDNNDQNHVLAETFANELNIAPDQIIRGLNNCEMDRGKLAGYEFKSDNKRIIFINSFAANDPISSSIIIDKVVSELDLHNPKIIGLLSLRMDRGERSQQWLDYLKAEGKDSFDKLFYIGTHGRSLERKLSSGEWLRKGNPEEISKKIIAGCEKNTIVFGLVNIHKIGLELTNYWAESGLKIDLLKKDAS